MSAFLPQKVTFPDQLTGREVVEFYGALRGLPAASVDEALKRAALNGASTRPVGTYSGGMTQRLGLAVALAAHAPMLLLDEPTAALDPDGLCTFYGLIEHQRATRADRALQLASHGRRRAARRPVRHPRAGASRGDVHRARAGGAAGRSRGDEGCRRRAAGGCPRDCAGRGAGRRRGRGQLVVPGPARDASGRARQAS